MPTHNGELYYERHQGTYTSQANSKKLNRRIEELLHYVEWVGAEAFAKGITYDRAKVEEIWKEVLLYQFHDILPGSSIKRVYDESVARYYEMTDQLNAILDGILDKLKKGEGVTVINPVAFDRKEYIKQGDKWFEAEAKANSTAKLITVNTAEFGLTHGQNSIENGNIKVEFGEKGQIISMFDKINNKELVKEYFNKFTVYSDPFMFYNAWDINIEYATMPKSEFMLIASDCYIDGVKVVRHNTYKYGKSKLEQDVCLFAGDSMVRFDTKVSWHEKDKLLRADFVPTVFADNVKCDIQFGNIDRTTHNDNSVQKAQFEVCAHKYINLDGDGYGIALINDCKFGHKAKEGFFSLALLRAPKFPDPTCDMGEHTFSYAIYPHKERFEDSDLIARAYAFNNKLEVIDSDIELDAIVKTESKDVVIETIKVAEDNSGIIVRIYECKGGSCTVKLNSKLAGEAFECDMLENIITACDLEKLGFAPFEIKTILIKK
jgi:alpha-mannosidase